MINNVTFLVGGKKHDFDIEKHFVEEVAIVNLSKFHSYFEDRV
ncbi:Uncharacterised protein [Streptococcus pneumoniae]|nr:Uncharacterised protein [Streptococcus pneumoniae]VSV39711.1 Uncharacterised protein [Streptococcus pneumoniae]VSV43178.1 Uncharacterised protein [Streptococcus pneumoniae]VSY26325.1 Uncharacterised protein [Streptococcus pneumoniae]